MPYCGGGRPAASRAIDGDPGSALDNLVEQRRLGPVANIARRIDERWRTRAGPLAHHDLASLRWMNATSLRGQTLTPLAPISPNHLDSCPFRHAGFFAIHGNPGWGQRVLRSYGAAEPPRRWSTGGPIEQLDRVHDGHACAGGELRDAADVARRDDVGARAANVLELAVAQSLRELGLQDVVSARGAAAEMPFADLLDGEACGGEQTRAAAARPSARAASSRRNGRRR